jgi:ankyrin repeat protein
VNEKHQGGWTPLHYACISGHTATAVALIERGASVNEQNQDEWSTLRIACRSGHTATAVALIERGANVNEKDDDGRTPLHHACSWHYSATAIALLDHGAVYVNDKDVDGHTPSHLACFKCTADVVLRMIQIGAILAATELQRFRDRSTVTEEQACTVEDAYKREDNWRRRAHYAMFLSSIRDLVDVEHGAGPSAPASRGESGGIGRRTREAAQARLMRVVDKVLCRTNTQQLIGSFL